jgi:hypothetical protein
MKSSRSVILSTAYFPPVHYFMQILSADRFMLEKYETYKKQTFRNRCEIYTANGRLSLTVPVKKINGNHTRVDEMLISDQYQWQKMHWRAILSAYTNSPFFLYYSDTIRKLLFFDEKNLFKYNLAIIRGIFEILDIEKEIQVSEQYEKHYDTTTDLRNAITPKAIPSHFEFKPYYQTFGERHGFMEGLSILDLLFNLGPETRSFLRT